MFTDARARGEFTQELSDAFAELVREYHDDWARGGRTFRFYVGAYAQRKSFSGE